MREEHFWARAHPIYGHRDEFGEDENRLAGVKAQSELVG